ncbi:MAG: hypothetical protein ACLUSP_09620 [Christensenellales bacterium]
MKPSYRIHIIRLIAFIGVIAVMLGARFYAGGLCSVWRDERTVYGTHDEETVYETVPFSGTRGGYERIDARGGENRRNSPRPRDRKGKETLGKTVVYYAYSPKLGSGENGLRHGKRYDRRLRRQGCGGQSAS